MLYETVMSIMSNCVHVEVSTLNREIRYLPVHSTFRSVLSLYYRNLLLLLHLVIALVIAICVRLCVCMWFSIYQLLCAQCINTYLCVQHLLCVFVMCTAGFTQFTHATATSHTIFCACRIYVGQVFLVGSNVPISTFASYGILPLLALTLID